MILSLHLFFGPINLVADHTPIPPIGPLFPPLGPLPNAKKQSFLVLQYITIINKKIYQSL